MGPNVEINASFKGITLSSEMSLFPDTLSINVRGSRMLLKNGNSI
jgi:hypothetical protein